MSLTPQELRTYFTTFSTAGRRRIFQVEKNARLMVDTLRNYRTQGRFSLHAFVVMPDHVHALITPAVEVSLEKAIQFMKGGFRFGSRATSRCGNAGILISEFRISKHTARVSRTFTAIRWLRDSWPSRAYMRFHRPHSRMRSIRHRDGCGELRKGPGLNPLFFGYFTAG